MTSFDFDVDVENILFEKKYIYEVILLSQRQLWLLLAGLDLFSKVFSNPL